MVFPWFFHGFSMEKSLVSMVFLWKNPSHGVMPISNISGPLTMPPPTPKRPANLREPWKNHRKSIENLENYGKTMENYGKTMENHG
jgi:hypothetical protein